MSELLVKRSPIKSRVQIYISNLIVGGVSISLYIIVTIIEKTLSFDLYINAMRSF